MKGLIVLLLEMLIWEGVKIMSKLNIRDFIYLDVERLKSIISQAEHGLVDTADELKNNSKEINAGIEGSLFGFLKSVGGAKFAWQNQSTETRSLHDYIYNKVENSLVNNNLLIRIPEDITEEDVSNQSHHSKINDTSFLLINGKVEINDFRQMRTLLERFNDLGKFIAECSASSLPPETPNHIRTQFIKNAQKTMALDKSMVEGFKLLFDTFYKDRIVVKFLPFKQHPDFRFVGNLRNECLRDDISSIIYKYGTAPISKWTIFAQVASIPPKDISNVNLTMAGSEIELALHGMFNAFREIEKMAQSVVFPEIAITPIAIYRA